MGLGRVLPQSPPPPSYGAFLSHFSHPGGEVNVHVISAGKSFVQTYSGCIGFFFTIGFLLYLQCV